MGTEEWFLIKSRFKFEWEECLVLWVSWNVFLLLFANSVGVHFAAGRQRWELWAIKGVLRCPGLPALAPPGCRVPSFCSEGRGPVLPSLLPAASLGCSRDPLPGSAAWGFGSGASPAARGSLHAEACRASALPEDGQEAASRRLRHQLRHALN